MKIKSALKNLIWPVMILSIAACVKSEKYDIVPHLEFRQFSKNLMQQGDNQQDSVMMTLFFTDGDGDFGEDVNSSKANVFIKDLRTGEVFRQYKAPFVPLEGTGNGISGTINIKIFTTCCIYDQSTGIPPCEKTDLFPQNELPLEVYITDRAGNESNHVTTDILLLKCN